MLIRAPWRMTRFEIRGYHIPAGVLVQRAVASQDGICKLYSTVHVSVPSKYGICLGAQGSNGPRYVGRALPDTLMGRRLIRPCGHVGSVMGLGEYLRYLPLETGPVCGAIRDARPYSLRGSSRLPLPSHQCWAWMAHIDYSGL